MKNVVIKKNGGTITISNNPVIRQWQMEIMGQNDKYWEQVRQSKRDEDMRIFYTSIVIVAALLLPILIGVWIKILIILNGFI